MSGVFLNSLSSSFCHCSSLIALWLSTPAHQPSLWLLNESRLIVCASRATALSIKKYPRLGFDRYHASLSLTSVIDLTPHSCIQTSGALPSTTFLLILDRTVPLLPDVGGIEAYIVWWFWLLPAASVGIIASCCASVSSAASSNNSVSAVPPSPVVRVRVLKMQRPPFRSSM